MGSYIRGLESDGRTLKSIAQVEIQLIIYYGPTMAIRVVRFLWSIRDLII